MKKATNRKLVKQILRVVVRAVVKGQGNVTRAGAMVDGRPVRHGAEFGPGHVRGVRAVGAQVGVTGRAKVDLAGRRRTVLVPLAAPAVVSS